MVESLLATVNYFTHLPLWELLAVISALFYVVLAAKENIWCWPAALVSTIIYSVIFYDVYLWMDALLQVYYLAMAIFGWYCWRQVSSSQNNVTNNSHTSTVLAIQSWPLFLHIKIVVLLTACSLAVGWLMDNYTPTHFPYLDSATTVFAVFATYLVTKKVLENWLYWIVIDFVSIYLYLEKGLQPTAVLFGLYVVMAMVGYAIWYSKYQKSHQQASGNVASATE
ncbi:MULTISPECIES: nicotinamide riboside transporter PnuC [unclassified Colwellia]|uniref:nicotinamide riboside transporter PnuC n=1 Tax=unclassified Colwellia TaxID=196834 RepID=UPI0015F42AA1|nr:MULTISPECIES: nicotinamide riboside transporter PnuC [unclassified Colwellia]MBA6357624.1 nicotinamide mononucleotide transporter [Colwellia sp. BRX8-3]MBA6361448.1 nicotinamide mononucleotide transporter [Colwellia sp. BRX8-6]MBA6369551.1 nicotinamide mononucleotide transporter [Colwellia sp. BRX8-5]MBA6376025.1 nicotinamide mononucleotide transporter [Colwellia sp. BRX8-2]